MSYDRSNMSLGDVEALISYNQSGEMYSVYCHLSLSIFEFELDV